jgi:precorrin-6B methylase 2
VTVLDAAIARVHTGRVVVASATMESALAAFARLGNLVQVSVARGARVGEAGVRLAGTNPVFIAWGAIEAGRLVEGAP